MFFQISPVRREKKPKPVIKEKSPEKIEVLSLGPFAAAPKLFFDGIKLGEPATCKLSLRNPTKQDITIFLIKKIPEELNVKYSWESRTIEKNSDALFEISWIPRNEVASYHKITFSNDTGTIHRDVPIVFKTVTTLKKSKTTKQPKRKSPTKKYYPVKPPYVSPRRYSVTLKKKSVYYNSSPPNTNKHYIRQNEVSPLPLHNKNYIRPPVNMQQFNPKGKENRPNVFLTESVTNDKFIPSDNVSFKLDYLQTAERRDTYVLKRENSDVFNDSLEIVGKNTEDIFSPPKTIKQRPPLSAYNGCSLTPDISLGSYFKQKSVMPETPVNGFEYKLMQLQSFCFTPTMVDKQKENFLPTAFSSIKKKNEVRFELLDTDIAQNVNLSPESRPRSRLSSETYVKDNTSFETYIKDNLSGGTYTKDSSIGELEHLNPPTHQRSAPKYSSTPPLSDLIRDHFNNEPQINTTIDIEDFSLIKEENGKQEIDNSIKIDEFMFTRPEVNNCKKGDFVKQIDYTRSVSEMNNSNMFNSENSTSFSYALSERQLSSIDEESFINHKHQSIKKKSDLDLTANHARSGGGFTGPKDWSRKGGAAIRVSKSTSGLNLTKFTKTVRHETQEEVISQISNIDSKTVIIQNPFLLAATNMIDPFITPQLYVNDEWIDQQEIDFKKWLNSLLAPPQELYSEDKHVDVAKVWQECKKREVEVAPTKEEVSNKYHVNAKLNSLRKSAQSLFRSKEISDVLSKVLIAIDNGKLSIRQDKDVHLNLSIKSDIMRILLSYNPLWLRIGLETIYNETIHLHSNSDIVGLSTFLINRLFKNPYLLKKYKSVHSPKYVVDFNKFFLKKFFILVYFLDQAKNRKLIPHNPCLFSKTGAVKESRELLLILAREILSAVGDITKFLKFSGYVVTHVQNYIHEFDYAVNNLGVDLRDGVRLTKIMEIILLKDDLTNGLRVPAISRLQKVHNMKLVFESLETAGFKIIHDISPKDIVDGHREKTMSFLWQIIYKFEAPLMIKCANTIQTWFRSLPVVLQRRRLRKIHLKRETAAKKIQTWYKNQILATKLTQFANILKRYLYIIKVENAVLKIQTYYRMSRQRNIYNKQIETINGIQRYSRGWLVRNFYKYRIQSAVVIQSYVRMYIARVKYLRIKKAIQIIQTWYRLKRQTRKEVAYLKHLKVTTIFVQQRWRANIVAKQQKQEYEKIKRTVLYVQRRFRANQLCKMESEKFKRLKLSVVRIQIWYKSLRIMKICRKEYLNLKYTVLVVEQRYIALQLMKIEKENYQNLKNACIKIQQRFKAYKLMKETKIKYLNLKIATLAIQRIFRAKRLMQKEVAYYTSLKKYTIFVQRKYKAKMLMNAARQQFLTTKEATIKIQTWFRATIEMRKCRKFYVSLQQAVKFVEEKYKAKLLMKQELSKYQTVKNAVIIIQTRYRALMSMKRCLSDFNQLKLAVVIIQRIFRANKAAKLQRRNYVQLKNAAVTIQTKYRAKQEMLKCKNNYNTLKATAVMIQNRYRAKLLMTKAREEYQCLLRSVLLVQRAFRAKQSMLRDKENYLKLKQAATLIQTRWRAKKIGQEQLQSYQNLRTSAIFIQQNWRAIKMGKKELARYTNLRRAVMLIQCRWRAKKLCQAARKEYLTLKKAALVLQKYWKAKVAGKVEQQQYQRMKYATLLIQRKFRATLKAKIEKREYQNIKKATTIIQIRWRAYKVSKLEQIQYQKLRSTAIFIQQHWRATIASRKQRNYYLDLQKSTLLIQERWRSKIAGRQQRENYVLLRKTTIFIQQKWRANIESYKTKCEFKKLKNAVIFVQNRWRCKILSRKDRMRFQTLRLMTIYVQRQWRCLKLGRRIRDEYQLLRKTVVFVQQKWRAKMLMKIESQKYVSLKICTIKTQRRFRATLEMKRQQENYTIMRKSALTIQRWYRSCLLARKEQKQYLIKKKAVHEIQRYARGYLVRKKYAEYFTPEAIEKRKTEKMENEAATKIQALWRGYTSRCTEHPELRKIRARYIKANKTALPENTLHFKCKIALQTIAHEHSTLFHINHALEDIDYATRRCKNICITLGKLLPDQLYLMLSSTSRSLPEMNACLFSVNILISFNKLRETKDCSFVPGYIEKLITLMMHWCDKESMLFPTLCTLFWLFAHTPQWRRFIVNLPNIHQKFEKIRSLVSRKENMVKRQGSKGTAVFASYRNLPMPSLLPDWGLDYKTNPFAFTNSVHALNSLMTILNL